MTTTNPSLLLTGACGDIGRALAREFGRQGAGLALCDLVPPEQAQPLIAELQALGSKVLYRQVDVTQADAMQAFVREAAQYLDGLDIAIANAGIVERGPLVDLAADAWRRTLEVNLTGSFLTAQAAARAMLATGRAGHIVFISSWVQDVPREDIGAYCASKGGLKLLAKCLALELAPRGIRVNLVAPGWVAAGLTGKNLRAHPERRPVIEGKIPLGRLISAEELARSVRMLCSADAAYMTGTTLLVDGGSSMGCGH